MVAVYSNFRRPVCLLAGVRWMICVLRLRGLAQLAFRLMIEFLVPAVRPAGQLPKLVGAADDLYSAWANHGVLLSRQRMGSLNSDRRQNVPSPKPDAADSSTEGEAFCGIQFISMEQ